MEIVVLAKLQMACLIMTIFIGILYFSSKRVKNKLHKSFAKLLIALPIYLILDILTVVTVNNMDTMSVANDVCHRFFFIALIITVYLFCNHMYTLIENEGGEGKHRKIIVGIENVILIITSAYSLLAKPAYSSTKLTGFAVASFAGGAFAAVGLYIAMIVFFLVTHWTIIPGKKKLAISVALVIEGIGLYFQMLHTDLLLSGFILTCMMLAFYLTLENPDAILLQEVALEKEKADAANASKSAFLSVVSHEIRTPMNAVVGMTDLLLRDKESLNSTQEKYLRNIKNSGASLVMIVNDILDQSKIEAGKMEIVNDVYELRPLVEDVKLIIENRIGSKPVRLHIDIEDAVPGRLLGDSLRIRQILINLLNNAVKFTEEGYIRLSISLEREEEQNLLLKFSVKDSGQGIRKEDLEKLGKAFSQVDVEKNHGKEGTGLGLSISRDFISMMGGQLEVSSEYGKGSDFYFSINQGVVLQSNENDPCKQAWKEEEFTAPDARILVVDDTEINLMVTEAMLEPLLLSVDTANNAETAIEMIQANRYDLVFMDYMMPYMDGVEATKKIRELEGEDFKTLPIVALSADSSEKTLEEFMRAGMDDFAEKPMDLVQMKKIFIKWIPKEKIIYEGK